MTVAQIAAGLEELAPLPFAEDFDNVGLLVGDPQMEVTGVLVTLDTLEDVLVEAREKGCNLVVSFHPILFQGLKRITGATYVERVVARAIEQRIAIYSMHTALDNVREGVNGKLCEVLGLTQPRTLIPRKGIIKKLVTYVPEGARQALLENCLRPGPGSWGIIPTAASAPPEKAVFCRASRPVRLSDNAAACSWSPNNSSTSPSRQSGKRPSCMPFRKTIPMRRWPMR